LLAQRFATNPLSQTAQLWLGEHFFSQGDYAQAELACVGVITNVHWKGTRAVQQARLKAGQAALARGSSTNAVGYLLDLLNDPTAAEDERAPAYFYLGEARLGVSPGTNAPLSSFSDALEAFQGAARFTNAPIVIAAWGRMAFCHLQLGAQTPVSLQRATELYQRVTDSPQAGIAARAKARIGMAMAAERMASGKSPAEATELLERALKYYLDVVLGSGFLRPGESVPPLLLWEAGDAAGRLLQERKRIEEAVGLFELLGRELPAYKPIWDSRRDAVRKLATAKP
jgi:tetratricopeptide (TPR) repeat protein